MRMRSPKVRKALVALAAAALAIFSALALLEISLRTLGWVYHRPAAPQSTDEGVPILCIGDSWTFGDDSGDPKRLSYPAQLGALLDRPERGTRYNVLNMGLVGLSSSELSRRLPHLMKHHRPYIVIVLTGGANWSNLDQMMERARLGREMFIGWDLGPLERLRVVRVGRLLFSLPALVPRSGREATSHVLDRRYRRHVTRRLKEALFSTGSVLDVLGAFRLSYAGCSPVREARKEIETARDEPPEAALARVRSLEARLPECLAAKAAASNHCLRAKRPRCGRAFAKAALELDRSDPTSRLNLALADLVARDAWTPQAIEQVKALTQDHGGNSAPHKLLIWHTVQHNKDLCYARFLVDNTPRGAPDGWRAQVLDVLESQVGEPARLAQWADLGAIYATTREHGAHLLLLNYPTAEWDSCRQVIIRQNKRFAETFAVPLLDLSTVLGPHKRPAGVGRDATSWGDVGYFANPSHPNARGYGKVAEAVVQKLASLGWL